MFLLFLLIDNNYTTMCKDNNTEKELLQEQDLEQNNRVETPQEAEGAQEEEKDPMQALQDKVAELEAQHEKDKSEYLFLMAEFDNFRKRTIKEKADIIKNAAQRAMADLLPVVDDFERAVKAMADSDDAAALREGTSLIYNKFMKYLEQNSVKPINSTGAEFDTELHEAVTTFPVDDEALKNHVIDTVVTGYTINDKVLRHAKVVVGQ